MIKTLFQAWDWKEFRVIQLRCNYGLCTTYSVPSDEVGGQSEFRVKGEKYIEHKKAVG